MKEFILSNEYIDIKTGKCRKKYLSKNLVAKKDGMYLMIKGVVNKCDATIFSDEDIELLKDIDMKKYIKIPISNFRS